MELDQVVGVHGYARSAWLRLTSACYRASGDDDVQRAAWVTGHVMLMELSQVGVSLVAGGCLLVHPLCCSCRTSPSGIA